MSHLFNINSDGGNVNINGAEAQMDIIKELTETVDVKDLSSLIITNPVGDVLVKPSEDDSISMKKVMNMSSLSSTRV